MLLHRFNVLVNSGRVSNYVSDGIALLAVLFRDVFHRNDLKCKHHCPFIGKPGFSYAAIMHLSAKTLLERMKNKTPNIADSLLSLPEWWSLFLTVSSPLSLPLSPSLFLPLFVPRRPLPDIPSPPYPPLSSQGLF